MRLVSICMHLSFHCDRCISQCWEAAGALGEAGKSLESRPFKIKNVNWKKNGINPPPLDECERTTVAECVIGRACAY